MTLQLPEPLCATGPWRGGDRQALREDAAWAGSIVASPPPGPNHDGDPSALPGQIDQGARVAGMQFSTPSE